MSFIKILLASLLFAPMFAHAQTIETPAREAFLLDSSTGKVLLDKGADAKMPTSSMSKMMTVYMAFDALKNGKIKLDDEFAVSEKAWKMEGSRTFAQVGSKVQVEDLIRGVIIQSGNDAAVVLAEGIGGSEETFVQLMNAKMQEIGMKASHFINATGLPDEQHYSTPRDLSLLAIRLINDFPEHYHYFSEKEFVYNNIKQGNRNPLLYKNMGVDGLKTGHADEAGYGITASAIREGRRLVLVVNGLKDMQERADESARLINWGYAEWPLHVFYKRGAVIGQAKVAFGTKKTVPVAVTYDVQATVHKTQVGSVKVTPLMKLDFTPAPIARGAEIGKLTLNMGDENLATFPLVAEESVERLPFFEYWMAKIKFMITGKME